MTGKKTDRPGITQCIFLAMVVFQLFSCAAQHDMRQESDPLLGQWKTDRNIIITVHLLAGNGLVAEISSAPGFYSTDLGAGTIIVRNIQLLAKGKYSGLFSMPGNEQPIKVQLSFMNRNTVVVDTGDRRAKGNKMLWRRLANSSAPKP